MTGNTDLSWKEKLFLVNTNQGSERDQTIAKATVLLDALHVMGLDGDGALATIDVARSILVAEKAERKTQTG